MSEKREPCRFGCDELVRVGHKDDHAPSCPLRVWVERQLADAPPLTGEQARTIARLLAPYI